MSEYMSRSEGEAFNCGAAEAGRRIAELEAKLAEALHGWRCAEESSCQEAKRADEAEAKLARVVEAVERVIKYAVDLHGSHNIYHGDFDNLRAALAAVKPK